MRRSRTESHAGKARDLRALSDTSDALYTLGASLAASLTPKSQVRIELLDTYKGKPPNPAIKKNDVATVFSIGYKF